MSESVDLESQVDLEKVAAEIAATQPKWLKFFEPSTEKILALTLLVAIALCVDLWKWGPAPSVERVQENQVRVASSAPEPKLPSKPLPVPAPVPQQRITPEFLRLPLAVHIMGLAPLGCVLVLIYCLSRQK